MSNGIVNIPWGQEKEVYTDTFNKREMYLGAPGMTPDGRLFHWAFSGGAIGAGKRVESSPATAADDQDLSMAVAGVIGDLTVQVTTAGAIAANLYADGYLLVNDGTGEGHVYGIRSHDATTGVATITVVLYEKIRTALATGATTLVGFVKNPYKDVIIGTAASTAGASVGVAPTTVTDNDYFWCQAEGFAAVLAEDPAMVIGDGIEKGVDVAGAFQLFDVSADTDQKALGEVLQVAPAAGDYCGVMLKI